MILSILITLIIVTYCPKLVILLPNFLLRKVKQNKELYLSIKNK